MSSTVGFTENITLINLTSAPADMCFFASFFEALTASGINVDMISQNPPQGSLSSLSFTILDDDLQKSLKVIAEMRALYHELKTSVSSQNTKILVTSEEMRTTPGFAAKVFQTIALSSVDVRMITTSEVDISLLVTGADGMGIFEQLQKAFS